MRKILVQAGHYNTLNNCDPYFRGMTGAPDEQRHNFDISKRLVDLLNQSGFEAHMTDANINCPSNSEDANKDWDLFIALHCDANYSGDQGGGFIDYPDPSVDSANAESKRIKEAIESMYFGEAGIRNVPSRSNPNTKFYYAWNYLTAKTPCVILEMGESVDPHDSVILNDVNRVANAILHGIQRAFPDVAVPAPPVDPCAVQNKKIDELTNALATQKVDCDQKINTIQEQLTKALADRDSIRQQTITDIKSRLQSFIDKL